MKKNAGSSGLGRPRTKAVSGSNRELFQVFLGHEDRTFLEFLQEYLGLSSSSEAARVSITIESSYAVGYTEGAVKVPPPGEGGKIFTLRLNTGERARLHLVRSKYELHSDADAVRHSIRKQYQRTFGGG